MIVDKPKFDRSVKGKNEVPAEYPNGGKILCAEPCGSQLVCGQFAATGSRAGKYYHRCLKFVGLACAQKES